MNWLPKSRVIVPVDFSEVSLDAINTALSLVDDPANVYVVHVIPDLQVADPGVVWQTIDDESRRKHASDAVRERLADHPAIQVMIEIGDPGHRIPDLAKELSADLIVLTSHGRSGLERVLLGSVAERILRHCECPVLVLKRT